MSFPTPRRLSPLLPFVFAAGFLLAACSSNPSGPTDPGDIDFLVGDWEADSMVAVNLTNLADTFDILAAGGSFRINVQPSGIYTATLTYVGATFPAIGELKLEGTQLTLYQQSPYADTSGGTLTQLSGNRIRLVGESSFDFGPDGTSEPAELFTEFVRQ